MLVFQAAFTQQFSDMSSLINFAQTGRNHGLSVGDFNNDGHDDIYVSRREGKNKLFVNQGDFDFVEMSSEYGIDYEGDTNCSLWWDYDNDGDLDLYLGNKFENTVLYRNDGDVFTDVTEENNASTYGNLRSLNAADIDNDGDLDLYIAFAARQNVLLLNEGDDGFSDVLEERGIDDKGSSMGAVFMDYNQDGWIDLYQTRDGNQGNLLYLNTGDGFFEDKSEESRAGLKGMGMGVDVGYINDDEWPDLYVTNLYENFLLLNNGSGRFVNLASQRNVDDRGMGWGTLIFDVNNDSNNDIYIANESDFPVQGDNLPNKLYMGNPYMIFESDEKSEGIQNMYSSYGTAYGDFDNDGYLDLLIANQGEPGNQIFKNTASRDNNFIKVKLDGNQSNSFGIGARMVVYHSEGSQSDILTAGAGYASQNPQYLHFGLGAIDRLDSLVIYWPSGIRQRIASPDVNTFHTIEENESEFLSGPVVWTVPAFPSQTDDITVYFDAKEGNGALAGFSGPVFAHTGLITNQSNSPTDWKNVIGDWGTYDTRTLMTNEGNDIYSLSYNITDFYDIQAGTVAERLAFVFRNSDGSIVGRDVDGSDIYYSLSTASNELLVNLISPVNSGNRVLLQDEEISIQLQVNREANIKVLDNGDLVIDTIATDYSSSFIFETSGQHQLEIIVSDSTETQSFVFEYLIIDAESQVEDPPADSEPGLNYSSSFSYIFQLYAPGKKHVFLLCPANRFKADEAYRLKQSQDGNTFWIELPKTLFQNDGNVYQYLVDGNIAVADPFSEIVLDPAQDQWVPSSVKAELPTYPSDANGIVTVFDLEKVAYPWELDSFEAADEAKLVIYELLIRDFLSDRRYTSLTDTLDYLQRLGVNAIELMPIQEFEANDSWGYNPSFHMAVDKYYGSREELKRFIDEAHKRGIAVILDVVFNHCFSQSPIAQLWWDNGLFRPTPDSPYLNVVARHPFNVGYDFNHESEATNYWVKRVLRHWITEYKFDGFRFDLSKGLTQRNSGSDAGYMSQYDASRISILKDYADYIWSLDADNYVILEHFANNDEETELANYGMMLWGNMNHQFNESIMGYPSELEWADYKVRGWNNPNLISYMESHDEERLMYRTINFGDSEAGYNTRNRITALDRVAAATALFYSIPGPKMLWQFGEMGYDFSINRCSDGSISNDCRLTPKPVRWDYLEEYYRARLFDVTSAMIHLKTNYETFCTNDYVFNDGNFFLKTVHLNHPDMDAVCLVNFRTRGTEINPKFQYPGTWYEFFTGDSLIVSNVNEKLPFEAGEYRIYTSKRIVPASGFLSSTEDLLERRASVYPVPANSGNILHVELEELEQIDQAELLSVDGRRQVLNMNQQGKKLSLNLPSGLSQAYYLLRLSNKDGFSVHKVIIN